MGERSDLATPSGRAYRWWGVGAIACLVLAGIGVLGAVPLMVLGSGDLGGLPGLGAAAVFVLLPAGIIGAIYCGHKRYRASFANAHVSEGAIAEVSEVRNSEDNSYYFMLTVSAATEDGPIIRRHCTMGGKHPRPEIGQTLRFRHTTLDPDNLEDALFDSILEHR
ncbi:ABC transporter permease [Mycobacterium sp. 21AC1]|uniref:ABC transporter permease n=1 Tax=[Mycobacterium] appelbergii TaxID=2939269 RepID=UPI002939256C|nr:ABC transporter permease [Mycobacterium sp. 21AC1]MDV3123875.1 ABC transporter permease [Mycobacterium sp. 21AC1]